MSWTRISIARKVSLLFLDMPLCPETPLEIVWATLFTEKSQHNWNIHVRFDLLATIRAHERVHAVPSPKSFFRMVLSDSESVIGWCRRQIQRKMLKQWAKSFCVAHIFPCLWLNFHSFSIFMRWRSTLYMRTRIVHINMPERMPCDLLASVIWLATHQAPRFAHIPVPCSRFC